MRLPVRVLCCALLCLSLVACGSRAPEPVPTPTPTPEPTETDEPPAATDGEPISLDVDYVETQLLDNAVLRGQDQREPSEGTVDAAVTAAGDALARYLQTQFAAASTRFGDAGFALLLGEEVAEGLEEEQRRALGELDLEAETTAAEPVATQAIVLTDGDDLLSVTLVYDLRLDVTLADGTTERIRQRGELLFPAQDGEPWVAEMLEVTLDRGAADEDRPDEDGGDDDGDDAADGTEDDA